MRKKSHISLAGYLVREAKFPELIKYKKAFYLGSILPDLNPKMVKEPHEIEHSFEKFKTSIHRLIQETRCGSCSSRSFWRRSGIVLHYLADYFTFPHNTSYDGNLKDHCIYEGDMKHLFRAYIETPEARNLFLEQQKKAFLIRDEVSLIEYIQKIHREYLQTGHSAAEDCRWIVETCTVVLLAMQQMLEENSITYCMG